MALALPGPRRPASIRCDRPARQFSRSITLPRLADASCVFSVPHGLERALDRASLLACRVVPQRSERYPNPEQTAADASQDCHARWHARVARSFAGEQPMVDRARRLAGLYAYVHHFLRRVYYMGHHRVLVHCYRFVYRCVHSSFVRSVSELFFSHHRPVDIKRQRTRCRVSISVAPSCCNRSIMFIVFFTSFKSKSPSL
jgi:hypothetical protein